MTSTENDEAGRAWNTVLFDKFSRFRWVLTSGLTPHGRVAIARRPPAAGARVLDVGCGFGDMTIELARAVGPGGEAVGVDIAENFLRSGESDAREAKLDNARFFAADLQLDDLRGPYAAAYARFGTMFFASPVAALRNVQKSLAPGGSLSMAVWRKREDNPWMYVAEQCARAIVPDKHEAHDGANDPTCGPGPFSMRGADLV